MMNKHDFLLELSEKLASLPKAEIEKSAAYYSEIIDDRIEDGMTEEEAVAVLGDPGTVAENIMYDMSIPALMKARVNESKNRAANTGLWVALVILGFPLWFPLLCAFGGIIFAVYMTVWAIIVSLFAVVIALGMSFIAAFAGGIIFLFVKPLPVSLCLLGAALCCAALTLFMSVPVYLIAKWLIKFTAYIIRSIKSIFIKKRGSDL
jgi:uncharacterized membrane protein